MFISDNSETISALNLVNLIKNKEISPVEVIENTIKSIEKRNPSINAFVFYGFDEAREKAKTAEKLILKGDDLGLLHGIPVAIKDLFDFKPGWITTFGGIKAFKKNIANNYCVFAEKIEN